MPQEMNKAYLAVGALILSAWCDVTLVRFVDLACSNSAFADSPGRKQCSPVSVVRESATTIMATARTPTAIESQAGGSRRFKAWGSAAVALVPVRCGTVPIIAPERGVPASDRRAREKDRGATRLLQPGELAVLAGYRRIRPGGLRFWDAVVTETAPEVTGAAGLVTGRARRAWRPCWAASKAWRGDLPERLRGGSPPAGRSAKGPAGRGGSPCRAGSR